MVVEFSIVPIGRGEELAGPVAKLLDIIDHSGLPYKVTAMGTIVEGEWEAVLALIKECHSKMRQEAGRVMTHIAIDDREGAKGRLEGKVKDIEGILHRLLKK
ncbi:MAG: MTH1187 family thiamine-binding protein [Candidatus Aminicenantales bacterium]